jgi:hypothetical protein
VQQGIAGNEICLARLDHLGGDFVRPIRNSGIESKNITRLGDPGDDGSAASGGGGKLRSPGAQHKNTTRQLSLDKEHGGFWVDGGGFDLIQPLQGGGRQITEQMILPRRAGEAVIEDIQAVGSAQSTPFSADCITDGVIRITKSRDSKHGRQSLLRGKSTYS